MLLTEISDIFSKRRDKLMAKQPSAGFVIFGAEEVIRNHDVRHPHRQDSNFFYLTGFEEAESVAVVLPPKSQSGTKKHRLILFVRRRDQEREMWEGVRYGVEGAREIFNADEAFEIGDLEKKLPDLLESVEQVYFRLGMHPEHDRKVMEALASVKSKFGRSGKGLLPIFDAGQVIGEMRLFKDPTEIESLRKAAKVSSRAHNMAMEQVKPEMNEFDIEALIEYQFKRGGCRRLGYGSIVAGGKNATCLHYTYNNEVLKDGDLLLIDAGGEFDYYTADITRTFPVSKKFSTAQAKVYDLVLKSQKEAISKVKPGMKFQDLHKGVCEALLEGMLSLGVLSGDKNDLLEKNAFRRFYPHGTSHFLGMDVHDAGLYKTNGEEFRLLEPGMVFTVEPGFYVQPVDKDAPAEFRDIGIRIEDNILVTEKGFENLTESAVKERDAIEALRGA